VGALPDMFQLFCPGGIVPSFQGCSWKRAMLLSWGKVGEKAKSEKSLWKVLLFALLGKIHMQFASVFEIPFSQGIAAADLMCGVKCYTRPLVNFYENRLRFDTKFCNAVIGKNGVVLILF